MTKVQPFMCLKVKKGTFFMPETDRVFFKNNAGSFRMEGPMIHQWIEKLIPMLNGSHTMENLTDGLPKPYRERLYEITDTLYQNGFLLDVSQERPHELKEQVEEAFAAQIEYLESFVESPAYHFQRFRQKKVLAIGEGTMVTGLVSAMLQAGLANVSVFLTDPRKTNVYRLSELETAARKVDPEASVSIFFEKEPHSWADEIDSYDAVLYVSPEGKVDELQNIMNHCLEKKKAFLPAVVLGPYGMAGPYINEASEKDWPSAWRSLPEHMKSGSPSFIASRPAQSMLSTVMVFELFKKMIGVEEPHQTNHTYLMNMETLEGKWHPFKPHPLVTRNISTEKMNGGEESSSPIKDQNESLYYFGELTASPLGIFHHWEEKDLEQLPLSLCGVQVVHARSQKLTPEIIAGGKTHEEARREAGFMGVEAYAKTLEPEILQSLVPHAESPKRFSDDVFHIGAGENHTISSLRALQKAIENVWTKDHHKVKKARKITLNRFEDESCCYYWQVLKTMDMIPELAISEDDFGFPVVWVKTAHSKWRGTVALHQTSAVRQALFLLIMEKQMDGLPAAYSFFSCSQLDFEKESMEPLDLPFMEAENNKEVLRGAVAQLEKGQHKPFFVKISMDPFEEAGVINLCGVWLERGDSR